MLRVLLVDLERFSPEQAGKQLAAIMSLVGSMLHDAVLGKADRVLRAAVRNIRR